MKRMVFWIGSIELVLGITGHGSASRAVAGGIWINPTEGTFCSNHPDLPPDSICVEWFQIGDHEDGTVCCVSAANLGRSSFGDCEVVVSRRGPRPGGDMG